MTQNEGNDILDRIRAAGRKVFPMHEYFAAHDPAGLDGYNSFLMSSIYEQDALDPKYKEIIMACACVTAGSSSAVIASHCRKALDFGATRAEILQAIQMTSAVYATRSMAAGLVALVEADPEGLP